jgi:hypothetical protein
MFFFHVGSPPAVRRTLALLQLPPRQSVASRVRGHGTTGWPIRSHDHECNLQHDSWQIKLSFTKITLAFALNSSIVYQPHPSPLIIAASRCPDNHCRDLRVPAPGRCNWWTHYLKIKFLLVIYCSGRQTHSPPDMISHVLAQFRSDVVPQVGRMRFLCFPHLCRREDCPRVYFVNSNEPWKPSHSEYNFNWEPRVVFLARFHSIFFTLRYNNYKTVVFALSSTLC